MLGLVIEYGVENPDDTIQAPMNGTYLGLSFPVIYKLVHNN